MPNATVLDVTQPRKLPDGKTAWHNIGTAFAEQGKGIRVILRSMPLPQMNRDGTDIEVAFMLFPQKERRERSQQPDQASLPAQEEATKPESGDNADVAPF